MLPDALNMDVWTRVWWSASKYVINNYVVWTVTKWTSSPCRWDMHKLFHHHMWSKFHNSLSVHHTVFLTFKIFLETLNFISTDFTKSVVSGGLYAFLSLKWQVQQLTCARLFHIILALFGIIKHVIHTTKQGVQVKN